jgi:hypothetical protein
LNGVRLSGILLTRNAGDVGESEAHPETLDSDAAGDVSMHGGILSRTTFVVSDRPAVRLLCWDSALSQRPPVG